MRRTLMLFAAALLTACGGGESTAPIDAADEAMLGEVVPEYAISATAPVDAAGIGGARFPEELKLTAEQKAAIQALHEQFVAANRADIEALRAIELEARAAIRAGKSRAEVRAILEKATPIRRRLDAAFEALRAAIWAVYTPEQRAWIEANRPRPCEVKPLTQEQRDQIQALREAFVASVRADLELIKAVHEEARAAREAGKSRAEVLAILAKADAAMARVRAAERKLAEDIAKIVGEAGRCGRA